MIKIISNVLFPIITFKYASVILRRCVGQICFSSTFISCFVLLAGLGAETYGIREGIAIQYNILKIAKFVSGIRTINFISMILSYGLLILIVFITPKLGLYNKLILAQSAKIFVTKIGTD